MTAAAPLLAPWSWLDRDLGEPPMKAGIVAEFAAEAMGMAAGIEAVLELLALDDLRRETAPDDPAELPLFDNNQRDRLLRLAILCSRRVAGAASEQLTWAQLRAREHAKGAA